MVVQHIRESEEVAHVEEKILVLKLVGRMRELALSRVCVHGGG